MGDTPQQDTYLDSSALRAMSFHHDVARLLALSKNGDIRLYLSETTLWERARQQYENDFKQDRVVPYSSDLNRYVTWFKALFEKHGAVVVPSSARIISRVEEHLNSDNSYFNEDNENDQRDAHILATAELKLERGAVVLCHDENLAQAFEKVAGFADVRRDAKRFLSEESGTESDVPKLEKPNLDSLSEYAISTTFTESFQSFIRKADARFDTYLKTLPTVTDKLNSRLEHMQVFDVEIRKRLLGYIRWFSPISKDDVFRLLEPRRYGKEAIENHANLLVHENLLVGTENYWLSNNEDPEAKEICEQAMAVVMPEILEIVELD